MSGYPISTSDQAEINRYAINNVYNVEDIGMIQSFENNVFNWREPTEKEFYIAWGNNSNVDSETWQEVNQYIYDFSGNYKPRPFLIKLSNEKLAILICSNMRSTVASNISLAYNSNGSNSIRYAPANNEVWALPKESCSRDYNFNRPNKILDPNGETLYEYHGNWSVWGVALGIGTVGGSVDTDGIYKLSSTAGLLPNFIKTNMPIFKASDIDSINTYIDTGVIINSLNDDYIPKDFGIIYNVYIDGVKDPNIKVTWESSYLEENNLVDSAIIDITWHGNNPLFPQTETGGLERIKYTDSVFKSSYSGLDAQTDSGIFDFLNWDNIRLQLQMGFTDIDGSEIIDSRGFVEIFNEPRLIDNERRMYGNYGFDGTNKYNSQIFINPESGGEGGINDDGYEGRQEESDELSPTEGYSLAETMATIYGMTADRLSALARFLWNDNLFDNIKLLNNSPIENVVSVKLLPLSLTGSNTEIVLGNVETGVTGLKLSASTVKFTIGSLFISPYYNNFFDFSPYTSITIFIPFIGFKELDCNAVMGKTIAVEFIVDLITGACKSVIKIGGYQIYEFDGNCGIDVPLIASNRASIEAGYIQSAISGGIGIANGNISQGVNSMISGAMQQHHYSSSGAFSPSCGAFEDRNCFVIINRPQYQKIQGFGHSHGFMCCLTKTIKNLSGFTQTSDSVDLSSIPCLADEKEKIRAILSSGFYA